MNLLKEIENKCSDDSAWWWYEQKIEEVLESKFPNGLTSYLETYYEIVDSIRIYLEYSKINKVGKIYESQGRGGLYELAEELTDKFELLNKDREWDGDFFDEIEKFINEELK